VVTSLSFSSHSVLLSIFSPLLTGTVDVSPS
jgi:hypothetical protein